LVEEGAILTRRTAIAASALVFKDKVTLVDFQTLSDGTNCRARKVVTVAAKQIVMNMADFNYQKSVPLSLRAPVFQVAKESSGAEMTLIRSRSL